MCFQGNTGYAEAQNVPLYVHYLITMKMQLQSHSRPNTALLITNKYATI